MADAAMAAEPTADQLFDRLPNAILAGLTPDQKSAIADALAVRAPGRTPIDLRLSIPLPAWRFFVAILAGRERRSPERRVNERGRHPIRTTGNLLFILGGAMAFYLAALAAVLLWGSVIEL